MEGEATMFMRVPLSSSTLPIAGRCTVEDNKVTLRFPYTGIEFELPSSPTKGRNGYDFQVNNIQIW